MARIYAKIEKKITNAIERMRGQEVPNAAATARDFGVPLGKLRARWNGRRSKMQRPGTNRKPTMSKTWRSA
ncbi:MAG: hypothetical protein M1829_003205, partial [Trizodia sp. TS-e1964]